MNWTEFSKEETHIAKKSLVLNIFNYQINRNQNDIESSLHPNNHGYHQESKVTIVGDTEWKGEPSFVTGETGT